MRGHVIIFAGAPHEAYSFIRENGINAYTLVNEPYHIRQFERVSTIVMAGNWAQNPNLKSVENEARKRGMPIKTAGEWVLSWENELAKKRGVRCA